MKPFLFFLLIILWQGCAISSTDAVVIDSNNIQASGMMQTQPKPTTLSGKWNLIPALPADTATGRIPFLSFDTGSLKMNGNTGCNNIRGAYTTADGSLSFSKNIISTRMACAGYNEAAFLKNLLRVNRYQINGDTLQLMADAAPLSYWIKGK